MRKLIVLSALCLGRVALADTTYLALYLNDQKIGYASYESTHVKFHGKSAVLSTSRTVMDTSLLGTSMTIQMDSKSWSTQSGTPLRMWSETKSGGRSNVVDAQFGKKIVHLDIQNGGVHSARDLAIPTGSPVVDDPLSIILGDHPRPGSLHSLYVFDPSTASFLKNIVHLVGLSQTTVHKKKVTATLIEVADSRSRMKVYVNAKKNLVLVEGPAGINMLPVSKAIALSKNSDYQASTDLAFSTSIKSDKPIEDPSHLKSLKLRIVGSNLDHLPSDTHQTAEKAGNGWVIDVHPVQLVGDADEPIKSAGKQKPEWLAPSLNIPSTSPRFQRLAKKLVSPNASVKEGALAIQKWVYDNMRPNAGIGVLRDATEVLDSREGVCRDYATLTVTLLRAAGIPARLASGLVNWDGTFYYHAWAEAWNGLHWIGIDSTTNENQISATHIKLGEGNVESAFSFTFLEKSKIEIIKATK